MISNGKIKNEKGITLIEIMVAVIVITIFSAIVITDFPKMLKRFAISRAAYKMAQDIRRTEDYGFSGIQITGYDGEDVITAGYGFYIDKSSNDQQYLIYADTDGNGDYEYSGGYDCSQEIYSGLDCIIETITINDSEVYIKKIENLDTLSINFTPPNPKITITSGSHSELASVEIVLGLASDNSVERTIYINSSGLVYVE